MTTTVPVDPSPARTPARSGTGVAARLGYLAAGLPVGIVAVLVVTGLSVGIAGAIVWLGVPVLAVTLLAARRLADAERRAAERVTGRPVVPHHYRTRTRTAGWRAGALRPVLADPALWLDAGYALVGGAVRFVAAVVALSWVATGAGMALSVVWEWALPADGHNGLLELVTGDASRPAGIAVDTALGLVALAVFPAVARCLVAVCAGVVRVSLAEPGARPGRRRRLAERAALGADVAPFRSEPVEPAAQPVESTLDLDAALRDSVAACPVATDVLVAVGRPLTDTVTMTVHDVVDEALANVAAHAVADRATVSVELDNGWLTVVVTDDGRGGAQVETGCGLAGLAGRLSAVGGSLEVSSPHGGPTVVTAAVPTGA